MKYYIGLYTGESSKETLIHSPIMLGGGPYVTIVDLIYDEGSLDVKRTLKNGGIECIIKPGEGMGFDEVNNIVSRICLETMLNKYREGNKDVPEIYLEIGNLNNVLAGSMFHAAFRTGGKIVNYHNGSIDILSEIKPLPNVERRGYTAHKILDILFENDNLSYVDIRNEVYKNEIAGMSSTEIEEHFKNRLYNTYKVLNKLRDDGWVSYNKSTKTYNLTPEGSTARIVFELRDING